ncbi:MAG: hypothetical protein KME25_13415 [Symplocastrum torsivum CPER-KK1]|jgi:hypothetical protein|uniref:Uncharacterized protein n=1 Tax=Symplocastrum torsivum CPER-KK1 TaxID=450513 RepID=A0A951U9J7_9CYAN|nr:hypothetical protein [Symplocastrum torsivum CPER-KK1]
MIIVIALFVVGFVAAVLLGTQAYFRGEQSKPIHERNWRSESFEKLAESITGTEIDYTQRTPAYQIDAYSSQLLPNQ